MLVVRGQRAISHAPIHEMSKVEDGMPGFEEKFGQDRDLMVETTRKKMASRAASK